MLLLGMTFIAAVIAFMRAPLVGVAVTCLGIALFLGITLPQAHGVVFAVILLYTVMFLGMAVAVLLYRQRRRHRLPFRSHA